MMRMPLLLAALLAAAPLLAAAQAQPNPAVAERAENLSGHMVRDLHLNAYQADRTRQINLDYTSKLAAVEHDQAANPTEAARQAATLEQAHEKALQDVLTTDQFTDFFDSRKRYAQLDHDYATQASAANLQNAIQHPAPARANNAVLEQGKAGPSRNRPAVRQ